MRKQSKIKTEIIAGVGIFSALIVSLLYVNTATFATGVTDEINVTIPASCSLTSVVGSAHTSTIENSTYVDDIGETTFKVFCNDFEGFAVYAVGYTNDSFGNNTLKPANLASSYAIATGTATSGGTSNWAMKLTAVSGDYTPTLETGFNDYHVIPDTYTKVASFASNTDASTGSSFKSTYGAFISQTQPADSYTGKVKYTVVHPANGDAPMSTIGSLTYMQDFKNLTNAQKNSVLNSMSYGTIYNLIDNRDNKTYQIARLKDDNIWMAENLDLGRTALTQDLTNANTNLDANATAITASTFNSWINASTNSYTAAKLIPLTTSNTSNSLDTDPTSTTPYGTLYNYCAASAKTICSASNSNNNDATSDLCPAGWRLPTGGDFGEFQALYNLTDYNTATKMRTPIVGGGAAFALAGYFGSSAPASQGTSGYYWSSTRFDNPQTYVLTLGASSVRPAYGSYRSSGYAVRCIAKRPVYSITVSYGTGISDIRIDGKTVQDGETIALEKYTHQIIATPSPGYGFSSWSTTAGQIDNANTRVIDYALSENTTISATASYVSTEIQNIASSSCTTTASYARDNRDDHVYTIQRLADGKCWMMENLDLGRTELTTNLTSSNTHLTNTVTAATFNSWIKTSGTRTYTYAELIPLTTSNTRNSLDTDPTSRTPYGTLYNYCAASAGTICAAEGSNSKNATSDLCPAGWRLPTGGYNTGDFQSLYSLSNYNTLAKMRASIADGGAAFAFAGNFDSSTPDGQGSRGYYWSSTRYDGTYMYYLNFDTSYISPSSSNSRYNGNAVRCVANT